MRSSSTQASDHPRVMRRPRFLVREPDLMDLDHRRAVRRRFEGHGHDRVPELGRGRRPGEDQTAGSVDLPIGAGVHHRGFVVDHDDAERPADTRIRFGASLPDRRTAGATFRGFRASNHASKRSSAGAAISRRTVTANSSRHDDLLGVVAAGDEGVERRRADRSRTGGSARSIRPLRQAVPRPGSRCARAPAPSAAPGPRPRAPGCASTSS